MKTSNKTEKCDIYLNYMHAHENCNNVHRDIVHNSEKLKRTYISINEEINKLCCFHMTGYYKAIKMNGFDLSGTS